MQVRVHPPERCLQDEVQLPQVEVQRHHEPPPYAREPDGFETAEKNPVNFAILTTDAINAVDHIHDRMPVILPLHHEKAWLPPTPSGQFFFPPFPSELLTAYPVTPKMNRASFNEPAAIAPLENVIPA
jgi:putative SOS response-associated peptidase YedK